MIVKPGTFRLKRSLNNQVERIFANGQDGFWYDPLMSYLYDTSAGVAQVDAAEDPIGLWIDRSKGAGLGPELIPLAADREFTSDTGYWTKGAGWTISGGTANADITTGQLTRNLGLVAGKTYQISVLVTRTSGTLRINPGGFSPTDVTASGSYTFRINTTASGTSILYFLAVTSFVGSIDNVSVKLLDGNHSIQATAAARPTYRVDANGLPYAAFLGTDDNMTSATGGGGTTGFYLCAAILPAGGAGTAREIYSDSGTNTGIHVELDASNKLSMSAGNGTAFTTLASTATVDVSTPYVLEAYIDSGVMYVKINGATAESVAAPTITAGTAGFTIGKDNLLASDFMIGNFYHLLYVKNSALTAAQRLIERKYAASKIGLSL